MRAPAAAILAALLLAGCATTPQGIELPDIGSWEVRKAVLGDLREWQFSGRIAVKAGDDGFNGKFNWLQQDSAFRATVGGPLGVGTVRIEGSGGAVVLTDSDGVETILLDAERDLRRRYGWTLPLASLRYWALGIPDPAAPALTQFDSDGRLRKLEQSDWTVAIARYSESGGQQMPRILSVENPDTRVRMVIDQWLFFGR